LPKVPLSNYGWIRGELYSGIGFKAYLRHRGLLIILTRGYLTGIWMALGFETHV